MAENRRTSSVEWRAIRGQLDFSPELETGGMPDGEVSDPDEGSKGWNRASIGLNTHPLHPWPDLKQEDLILPSAGDRLILFGACLLCGAIISILWLYFPLFIAGVMVNSDFGVWKWVAMAAAAIGTGLGLFAYASAEERRYAETL